MSDAIGTCVGACTGTSTVTSFIESATGVAAGGRTGLASLTTGLLFFASLIFAPVFTSVPAFATAPALVYVGYLMMGNIKDLRGDHDPVYHRRLTADRPCHKICRAAGQYAIMSIDI